MRVVQLAVGCRAFITVSLLISAGCGDKQPNAADVPHARVKVVGGVAVSDAYLNAPEPGSLPVHSTPGAEIKVEGGFRLVEPSKRFTPIAVLVETTTNPSATAGDGFGTHGVRKDDQLLFSGTVRAPEKPGEYWIRVWQGSRPQEPVIERKLIVE